jgi:transcriptional regulator with XRE-family HTH domain
MATPNMLATGRTVADNITRERKSRGLTLAVLSRRLGELTQERAYPASTLSEIEHYRRRTDVDDLVVLSAALGVSPLKLLMPPAEDAEAELTTTTGTYPAGVLWDWLIGLVGLDGDTEDLTFRMRSTPSFTQPAAEAFSWDTVDPAAFGKFMIQQMREAQTDGDN